MVGAWASVEVIRYSYLMFNLIDAVPGPLKWLRYSAFIILYPVGISGENLCIYAARNALRKKIDFNTTYFNYWYFILLIQVLYLPGSPIMFGHMQKQRKKYLSPPRPAPPTVGIQWPETNG